MAVLKGQKTVIQKPDKPFNLLEDFCVKSVIEMAEWLLDNLWTNVKDELPKTSNGLSKDVLCIDNRGCIIVAKYQDGVGWWSRGGTHWNTNGFTHWMPIPTLKDRHHRSNPQCGHDKHL